MPQWAAWLYIAIQLLLLAILIRLTLRIGKLLFSKDATLPFLPTSHKILDAIVASKVLEGKKSIVDLGSGNGKIIAALRKHYPNAQFTGVEHDWWLVLYSRIRFLGRKNIRIIRGDMFAHSVKDYDAIVGFWISGFTTNLLPKFEQECTSGTVIVSNRFPLPESRLFTTQALPVKKHRLFIYTKA